MSGFKRFLGLILLICALSVCVLVVNSCGGGTTTDTNTNTDTSSNTNTDTSTDSSTDTGNQSVFYTVYFQNQNGQPIEGVNAQICADLCLQAQLSDAEGVMVFEYFELAPFEVQINSVPDGYIMPEGYIPFPDGRTSVVITIQQNETYTVTASDLHGRKLENILVQLYLKSNDELVEEQITDSTGRATFVVNPDEYYAKISHAYSNGAFSFVGDTNEITFEKGRHAQVSFVILENDIDYTVTVKNADETVWANGEVKLYNERFDLVATQTTNEEGTVKFTVPNGTYYALASTGEYYANPVEFYKNAAVNGEISITETIAGTDRKAPIMLLDEVDFAIEAGAQAWYGVFAAKGKTVEIHSDVVEAFYAGQTKKPSDGKVIFELKESGVASFRVTSKAQEAVTLTGDIYILGSYETPIEIEALEENIIDVELEVGEKLHYSFVATIDGTIKVSNSSENAIAVINGSPFKKSVKAGDTVIICFYSQTKTGDETTSVADEFTATITYGVTNADYKVNVRVENQIGNGAELELYKKDGEAYVFVQSATCDENGVYVFANLVETADYYIKAICQEEYETVNEYEPFGDENEITIYINHERDGTERYPYLLNSEDSGTTLVEVAANGEAWYTLFYITGTTISIDNSQAKAELYMATGDSGAKTLIATLTGETLEYVLSEDAGTTARLLIKITMTNDAAGTVNLNRVAPVVEELE